jgi:cyclopropane fatty-acyl-phospholipid synthase-like methyltransferase
MALQNDPNRAIPQTMKTRLLLQNGSLSGQLTGINTYSEELDDMALDEGHHRDVVGGMWDDLGRAQFQFIRDAGLRPSHRLLDVGCGCLRGGVHFVDYLDAGHYFGADINASLLRGGWRELEQRGLLERGATLWQNESFAFGELGERFDFMLAVSVFTHLFFNHIGRCLREAQKVLAPQGVFFATFFPAPMPAFTRVITHQPGDITTHYDQDPFHCAPAELGWLAEQVGLVMDYVGDWQHPRGQHMAAFRHR